MKRTGGPGERVGLSHSQDSKGEWRETGAGCV
jgi:hypothetical protein